VLDRTLHRESDRLEHDDLIEAERELRVAGEQLVEAVANRLVPDVAHAARMDADDFLVLGPRCHHCIDVARLERLVERLRDILRRRVDRWRSCRGHGEAVSGRVAV
jgi:hypothetical protein